jgi:hypothetical protein
MLCPLFLFPLVLFLLSVAFAPCYARAALRVQENSGLEASPEPMLVLPLSFGIHGRYVIGFTGMGDEDGSGGGRLFSIDCQKGLPIAGCWICVHM